MRPRRTPRSNTVLTLPGGNEDHDLFVEKATDTAEHPVFVSTWELSAPERVAIAAGARIDLIVWGEHHPPVALRIEEAGEPL